MVKIYIFAVLVCFFDLKKNAVQIVFIIHKVFR